MFVNHQYSALLQIFFVGWFLKKFCAYGGRGTRRNPEDAKIGRGERNKSGVGVARKWLQTIFGSYYYIFESCSLCFFTIFVKKSEMTNLNKNFGVKRTF